MKLSWLTGVEYYLPAMQEMQQEPLVRSLGGKDPPEKEVAIHSNILA